MRKPTSGPAAFMPSPRPRARTSPEDAQRLADATGDLGFTRASNAPEAAGSKASKFKTSKAEVPKPRIPDAQNPKAPLAVSEGILAQPEESPAQETAPARPPARTPSLKFEVPDGVWVALRQEALNRRVTVRYLVLEALAAKGYAVDLSAVPEDGRRLR